MLAAMPSSGPPSSRRVFASGPQLGDVVGGRYRLQAKLGGGGMGTVFSALDLLQNTTVAVKVLHVHLSHDDDIRERFRREAEAARAVRDPHVVSVLDAGGFDSEAAYIAMEQVEGRPLAVLIAAEAPLAIERACRIAAGTLVGLGALHAAGVVHRDLKPSNILLVAAHGEAEFVKIFDLGVSSFMDASNDFDLTPSGRAMGTPYYASPEQISGVGSRDPRVDIYAVGVLLYEMLTGYRPFVAPTLNEVLRMIREDEPPPMRVFRKDVTDALEGVILYALAKDPIDRPQTALGFRDMLLPFVSRPSDPVA